MSEHNGRFVWHELYTPDGAKAQEFYTELLDWKVQEVDMGAGPYSMIHLGEAGIGGIFETTDMPTQWTAYVAVDDVDAAAGRATAQGGSVMVPPTDIPNVGRFAMLQDPTGASISAFKSKSEYSVEPATPPQHSFCWAECLTNDPARVISFYGEVFGWNAVAKDMGPLGTYNLFQRGEKDVGGTMQMPAESPAPPHWLYYLWVDDVDAMTARSAKLGGKSFVPPTDIPGIGRFSVNADPTGGMFAFYKSAAPK